MRPPAIAAFLFMAGDRKSATSREFEDLFQRFPTAANAHYLYGYLLFPMDADEAFAQFRRELEVAPTNAPARRCGVGFADSERLCEALTYSEKAVAEDPTLPVPQLVLAGRWWKRGM